MSMEVAETTFLVDEPMPTQALLDDRWIIFHFRTMVHLQQEVRRNNTLVVEVRKDGN